MQLAHVPEPTNSPGRDDRRVVSDVLRRDRKATAEFVSAEFVSRCVDSVYTFVFHRLAPRTEAIEDLMQEILLAAWQGLSDFRGDAGLRAWFLGIARHKVDDYYRKWIRAAEIQEDESPSAEPALAPEFEEYLEDAARQQQINRTLGRLPESYAFALLWRYRDEKSVREIAELTGKTEKSVERLLARARENFRKGWNDGHP